MLNYCSLCTYVSGKYTSSTSKIILMSCYMLLVVLSVQYVLSAAFYEKYRALNHVSYQCSLCTFVLVHHQPQQNIMPHAFKCNIPWQYNFPHIANVPDRHRSSSILTSTWSVRAFNCPIIELLWTNTPFFKWWSIIKIVH